MYVFVSARVCVFVHFCLNVRAVVGGGSCFEIGHSRFVYTRVCVCVCVCVSVCIFMCVCVCDVVF